MFVCFACLFEVYLPTSVRVDRHHELLQLPRIHGDAHLLEELLPYQNARTPVSTKQPTKEPTKQPTTLSEGNTIKNIISTK